MDLRVDDQHGVRLPLRIWRACYAILLIHGSRRVLPAPVDDRCHNRQGAHTWPALRMSSQRPRTRSPPPLAAKPTKPPRITMPRLRSYRILGSWPDYRAGRMTIMEH